MVEFFVHNRKQFNGFFVPPGTVIFLHGGLLFDSKMCLSTDYILQPYIHTVSYLQMTLDKTQYLGDAFSSKQTPDIKTMLRVKILVINPENIM